MQPLLSNFYLSKSEPNQSCLLAIRDIILKSDSEVSETIKYGMPCFYFKHKMFCYLGVIKKTNEPYLLMVEGKHLEHPKLEQGDRKRMKIFRVNANKDLPIDSITNILNTALNLYREGVIRIN